MFSSIPASKIVSVNPSVLSAGGSALSMNAVFLSKNNNLPTGQAMSFSSADSVAKYFGESSDEYKAATVYFKGFNSSSIKPSSIIFFAYNESEESAFLVGASVKSMELEQLKPLTGTIKLSIDGKDKTSTEINLSGATSFSSAAELIAAALGVPVTFDSQLQSFKISSSTTGENSTISYAAKGNLATALGLTESTGAVLSQGGVASKPATVMQSLIKSTMNWVTFTTVFEATLEEKKAFAEWSNLQNERFLYVGWGLEENAKIAGNKSCFGSWLKERESSGAIALYGTLDKAAFVCGVTASIDFTEREGRITYKFKSQSGLVADVTDETDADNLEANGYNYYGAWATASDRFLAFAPGQMTGSWQWIDAYINQIRINSQLQLAIVNMLMTVKSVPYNADGKATQAAACLDTIKEALNFGSIRVGVILTELQRSQIVSATGVKSAADSLETRGYYLYVGDATPQVRQARGSFPCKLFYTDGGSVHSANLASINVQ